MDTAMKGFSVCTCLLLLQIVGMTPPVAAQVSAIPIDIQVIGNRRMEVGETEELLVLARQPFGNVPWVFAESLPNGSTLEDNLDGTRTFSWTPGVQDVGETVLRLIAVDGSNPSERATEDVRITVLPGDSLISRLGILAPSNVIMAPNVPVSIRIVGIDGDGLVPELVILNLPEGASFDDNSDGSRTFNWIPPEMDVLEGAPPFTGLLAVQASAADDLDDRVLHIISFVVTDEFPPFQQPALEASPQIYASPAPSVVAGERLSVRVEAFHLSGQVPALMVDGAPSGASFDDNGDGSRELSWQTSNHDVGRYPVEFVAVDPASGDINSLTSTILVLASGPSVRADRTITIDVPLATLSLPGIAQDLEFDRAVTEYLIDVEFLTDRVDVVINGELQDVLQLLPGSNRLVIDHPTAGVRYTFDIDRATEADFVFENQIDLRAYDLDIDGNQIALATFRNVLVFTWEEQGDAYTRTAGGLDQQPWTSPASAVSLSGDTLAVASDFQEGVWVYDDFGIDGWLLTAHLQPDPSVFPQGFGGRMVLDGDTLAVSAIYDQSAEAGDRLDTSAPGSGAVAIFQREVGEWQLQAVLKASNADADDLFGISLALKDDRLVVGAVGEDSAASGVNGEQANNDYAAEQFPDEDIGAGAAYVFERTGNNWSQTAYLKPSDNVVPRMGFGQSVALSEDRIAVAAVAAPFLSGGDSEVPGYRTGGVYVFDANHGSWLETGIIKPTVQVASFGTDLELKGDLLAVAADRAVILYQLMDNQWRTLWSTNLIHGKVDFNAPFLMGPGVENFASSTLIFSSGR